MSETDEEIKLCIEELVSFNEHPPDISGNKVNISEEIQPDISGNKSAKPELNNSLEPPLVFQIGQISCIRSNKKRQRITEKQPITKKAKIIKAPVIEPPPVKDPQAMIEDMINLFFDESNYYYVTTCAKHKVHSMDKKELFLKPTTKAGHIKIIIPREKTTIENQFAYLAIQYQTGYLFDWQVTLGTLDISGNLFQFPNIKLSKTIDNKFPLLNSEIYKEADRIFHANQKFRWQMKRLVCKWLSHKSRKRLIGEDSDIITGDPIPKEEQIRIISIRNRTEYVFSGQVLVKTAKCCLEGQTGAIPNVKTPHNPYTNTPFTYGELVKVYTEILIWCAKKGKALPAIIGLYRDYKFKNTMLLRINHNYVQLKAVENYILNDDTSGEFFVEAMENMLEDFSLPLALEFDTLLIGYQRFRLWNNYEPKSPLMLAWKKLASDYWFYKQTEQFPRDNWRSESSIYVDLVIMLKSSMPKLREILKIYYRERRSVHVLFDEETDEEL